MIARTTADTRRDSEPSPNPQDDQSFLHRHWWPVAVAGIILLGTLVRVWLLTRANWMLDGDEATMALVGRHIQLDRERPIFFPGQAYMGPSQAYMAAILFELFGMSRPVAKLVPLISSAVWIGTTILLARRVFNRQVALLAGLFAAVPSLYLISTTLRISYPLIDVMAIGNVILLIAIDSAYQEEIPSDWIRRCLILGLLVGFAFWMHSAVAMYAAPAALLLFLRFPRRALFPGGPAALLGFLIGALPVFNHARQYEYTLFDYLRGNASDTEQQSYVKVANHLVENLLPRYLGVSVPWQDASPLLQAMVATPTVLALLYLAWRNWRAPIRWVQLREAVRPWNRVRFRPQDSHPVVVVLLFGGVVLATYVVSRFSVYAITFPNVDATGRYVAPIGSMLPIVLAGAAWYVWRSGHAGQIIAVALSASVLLGTLATYAGTDASQVFQSPYYRTLPESNEQLIATLDALDVDTVWMDHWAGKPLMFDSKERIAAADYVDLRVWGGIDRLGAASTRVFADDNPAFVFVTEGAVPLEETLRDRGIAFTAHYLDDYTVVLPAERVDPALVVDDLIAVR